MANGFQVVKVDNIGKRRVEYASLDPNTARDVAQKLRSRRTCGSSESFEVHEVEITD